MVKSLRDPEAVSGIEQGQCSLHALARRCSESVVYLLLDQKILGDSQGKTILHDLKFYQGRRAGLPPIEEILIARTGLALLWVAMKGSKSR